jgi:hypothetical protein
MFLPPHLKQYLYDLSNIELGTRHLGRDIYIPIVFQKLPPVCTDMHIYLYTVNHLIIAGT